MKEKTFTIHPLTRLLAAAMTLAPVLAAVTPLGAYASDSCTHECMCKMRRNPKC